MPGARTHDFITVVTAIAGAPVALQAGVPPIDVGALAAAYLFSGFFFSPDLDLHSTPYLRWRWLRFVWLPYQRVVHHRSWASHGLLIGPLVRILYFLAALYLLGLGGLLLLNVLTPIDPTGTLLHLTQQVMGYLQQHPVVPFYGLLGFIGSSAIHTIADWIQTGFKHGRSMVRRML